MSGLFGGEFGCGGGRGGGVVWTHEFHEWTRMGWLSGGMFGEGQSRAGLVGRGQIVVEITMWPWWGDGWMLSHCGGSAAPAGAVVYENVRPVADATG